MHFILSKNGTPINKSGYAVSLYDLSQAIPYEEAYALAVKHKIQVGMVLSKQNEFFCIDLDDCVNPATKKISTVAKDILQRFKNCHKEISRSKAGVHIIGRGKPPPHKVRGKKGIEFFTEKKVIALTRRLDPKKLEQLPDVTPALIKFMDEYDLHKPKAEEIKRLQVGQKLSDEEALKIFLNGGEFNVALWEANEEALAKAWPHPNGSYDKSSADASLFSRLARVCNGHIDQIIRLAKKSNLAREKWGSENYINRTIELALTQPKKNQSEIKPPPGTFLTIEDQKKLFNRCAFIKNRNEILEIDSGVYHNQASFNAWLGGRTFLINADATGGEKQTTTKAWTAFTENRSEEFNKVDQTCFRPKCSDLIIQEDRKTVINIYVPAKTKSQQGDVSRFLNLLKILLPNERDQKILLDYMCAVVQNPGEKYQWWPVVQGAFGNGKTFLSSCMIEAIGIQYCTLPRPDTILSNFNGWVEGNLFVCIEELNSRGRAVHKDILENLKVVVTNHHVNVENKYKNQGPIENYINGWISANEERVLDLRVDQRRFCMFRCAQQIKNDITRDGLTAEFFRDLWNWANRDGFAAVTFFLKNRKIENYDMLKTVAPETSCWEGLKNLCFGLEEEIIAEAIESCEDGFDKDIVFFHDAQNLLAKNNIRTLPRRIAHALQNLGYKKYSFLTDGRLVTAHKKYRIYVKEKSPASFFASATEIKKYLKMEE